MSAPEDDAQAAPNVRFKSRDEEIAPESSLESVESISAKDGVRRDDLDSTAQEELKNLAVTLQKSRQQKRLENFAYEPVSLPPSRIPSRESSSQTPKHATALSPRASPPAPAAQSPPLTPSDSSERPKSNEGQRRPSPQFRRSFPDAGQVTPQESPPLSDKPSAAAKARMKDARPRSMVEGPSPVQSPPKQGPSFVVGPADESPPPSKDASPDAMSTPATPTGGPSPSERPQTPADAPTGDSSDPSARGKRTPQARTGENLDPRFVFNRDLRNQNPMFGDPSQALPRSAAASSTDVSRTDKRRSFFGGRLQEPGQGERPHGSMAELKRFFRLGHKRNKSQATSRAQSPVPSTGLSQPGSRVPPSPGGGSVPFADDHGLQSKYGKFGKVLGSGAGGSVRLLKRSSDGVTFAVKQFRARHAYETEKEYSKKVTAEFCIGSTLHHGNIIETMDIVHEKGNWYEVMEYAPYDLFAIVMTGKMSRDEVTCCTLQVLAGVCYLHSMGLAHRDLKLDNVVVNEFGIMKIIDFGSAAVFRYPFENEIVLASGIVGSDPYLAPEVYDLARYDPQPTDIWSLAIMFCCMSLRRFPWKAPRLSDNSYKLFVADPDEDSRRLSAGLPRSEPASRVPSGGNEGGQHQHQHHHQNHHHHRHHHRHHKSEDGHDRSDQSSPQQNDANAASRPSTQQQSSTQVIKGPWRLLRLLPRESRHIVGKMLEIDPRRRATLEDILRDRWVQNAQVCRQEQDGHVLRSPGHGHTLEPGSGAAPPPPSNNKK